MMQAMVLVGVLVICAAAGVLMTFRHGRTPGPDEPSGSYAAPAPPPPSLPPTVVAAPAVTPPALKPSQPLPVETAVAPAPSPVRHSGRNSGFNRYAPATAHAVRRVTPGAAR